MLGNFRAMLGLLAAVILLILSLFFDGTLSNHLIDIGVDKELVGFFFGAQAMVYALSSPLVAFAARKLPSPFIT